MEVFKTKKAIIIGNGDLEILNNKKVDFKHYDFCLLLDSTINNFHVITKKHPDALLGDFDRNFNTTVWQEIYPNIKIIHTPDQEKTDFEKGIEYLILNNFTDIIGIGLTGKRMDHTFNNISSLAKYNNKINIEIIDEYSKIYCIDHNKSFKKHLKQNTIISLLPIGKVSGITTKNLEYNLTQEDLELGIRTGSSNTVRSNNFVEITITQGKLIIMECND